MENTSSLVLWLHVIGTFQGMGYKNFRFELLVLRDMTEPTFHILERKILGLWKKQQGYFSLLRVNCRI